MNLVKEVSHSLVSGANDSLRCGWAAVSLLRDAAFQRLFLHNVGLFLGSYALFTLWVIPNVQAEAALLGSSFFASFLAFLFGSPSTILLVCWLVPLYLYSVFCNAVWHDAIATRMLQQPKKRVAAVASSPTPSSGIADAVYRVVVYNAMLGLSVLSAYVPFYVGPVLQAVLYSLLYGSYCFEFKWKAEGWSAEECLEYLDQRWLYFVGFGSPLTLLGYTQASFFSAYPLTSVLVPIFCISAFSAIPTKQTIVPPLRFRQVSEAVALRFIVSSIRQKRTKKKETQQK